jgi:hypothetical protein
MLTIMQSATRTWISNIVTLAIMRGFEKSAKKTSAFSPAGRKRIPRIAFVKQSTQV